jgi:O-methyltransferase involved in polyketide biosynthesis
VWEGVTYYLSAEVVDNMLIYVKENAPPGSSICFDYAALSSEALNEHSVKKLRKHMRSQHAKEPTKFGIRAGEIDSFLSNKNFVVIEHFTADEMSKKYLSSEIPLVIGKVPPLFCLVHAEAM